MTPVASRRSAARPTPGADPVVPAVAGRILRREADLAEGIDWLRRREPRFDTVLAGGTGIPLRRREPGFAALLQSIVSQQLSVAAADAIWRRLAGGGTPTPAGILAADPSHLAACGLSGSKVAYARGLAAAVLDGSLPLDSLTDLPAEAALAELVRIRGIGRWTAEIYLMFGLGHADVIAAGDLALRESARLLFRLPERPEERRLRQMAANWTPWRAVAARLLWVHYRQVRDREGLALGGTGEAGDDGDASD